MHEAADTIGGGTRSAELTLPGFVHDLCSAVHPLGRGSPFFRALDLDVDWVDPPAAAAHPLDDGSAVVLESSLDATADSIGGADGRAYKELVGPLVEHFDAVLPVALGPWPPPPRALAALARALGPARLQRTLRWIRLEYRRNVVVQINMFESGELVDPGPVIGHLQNRPEIHRVTMKQFLP